MRSKTRPSMSAYVRTYNTCLPNIDDFLFLEASARRLVVLTARSILHFYVSLTKSIGCKEHEPTFVFNDAEDRLTIYQKYKIQNIIIILFHSQSSTNSSK